MWLASGGVSSQPGLSLGPISSWETYAESGTHHYIPIRCFPVAVHIWQRWIAVFEMSVCSDVGSVIYNYIAIPPKQSVAQIGKSFCP